MRRRNTRTCLQEGLKDLRLPTIRSSWREVAEQVRAESLSYEEFLLALVDQERDVRRQGRIERALRASNLPLEKTLEGFDRKRLPRKVDAHINVLLEGAFLDSCENVLAFGPPGSGKTHLLCAIGLELIYTERRVLFRRCDVLVQELLAAKRDLTLPKLLKQWSRFDLLIIDDIGYVQHSRQEMEVLFNLLALSLRARQRHDHQQSAVFTVGADLQGPHDDGRRHRSPHPPLCRPRAQRPQLPPRGIQETAGRMRRRPDSTMRVENRLDQPLPSTCVLTRHPSDPRKVISGTTTTSTQREL